ncbi:GIY-YIG nuclease family protein [Roseomonas sp. CECT 9278]|uniref:GIY-YIG nuclease family protein n=1 Tax=Roseomonas sp. CECT 9278 TaxID=2845823 RepID=UPI001E3BEA19|nr:GIY-YIG nuclease family protein [Roseomonas sp. CECT 9278]CAH0126625.1 hypothetical protein ROS9278_00103 [Roseomonas sp. CECT 9278]
MTGVEWVQAGPVTICEKGKPRFPKVPKSPGLYRIRLADGRLYIGQAKDLRRRLGDYRHPTKGNEGEHVIQHEIKAAKGGSVDIFVGESVADPKPRIALERAEIAAAIARGEPLLNDDAPASADRLRSKIRHHERQIEMLRASLAKIEEQAVGS